MLFKLSQLKISLKFIMGYYHLTHFLARKTILCIIFSTYCQLDTKCEKTYMDFNEIS